MEWRLRKKQKAAEKLGIGASCQSNFSTPCPRARTRPWEWFSILLDSHQMSSATNGSKRPEPVHDPRGDEQPKSPRPPIHNVDKALLGALASTSSFWSHRTGTGWTMHHLSGSGSRPSDHEPCRRHPAQKSTFQCMAHNHGPNSSCAKPAQGHRCWAWHTSPSSGLRLLAQLPGPRRRVVRESACGAVALCRAGFWYCPNHLKGPWAQWRLGKSWPLKLDFVPLSQNYSSKQSVEALQAIDKNPDNVQLATFMTLISSQVHPWHEIPHVPAN